MNTIIEQNKRLQRLIMRRVWYSYALSIAFSKAALRGFVMGFSGVLFFTLVSVPSILANLLAVEVGAVPSYVWQTITDSIRSGEVLQVVVLGVIIFSLLSFRFTFKSTVIPEQGMQHV
jgi:hypothetical protein